MVDHDDEKEDVQSPQESHNIREGFCGNSKVKTERMKQLDLSFRSEAEKVFAMESVEEVVAKTRVSKEDPLKRPAVGT